MEKGTIRKRIALLVGQADEDYQSRFIKGFLQTAFSYDMDVCVFSMYHKYQNTEVREKGDSNIFSLVRPELFDGVIVLADTIQTAGVAKEIEKRLHKSFHGPVLFIESDSKYYPSVYTDCKEPIEKLMDHLIEEHGYKDIAFLSGKKWHKHAKERLKAVREAMEKHGLFLEADRIIYGDFWYLSGELCADKLIHSEKGLPDAVVCANDAMAIGLCKAFESKGVKIPKDVAVVSYDSTPEGQCAPKSITSCLIPAAETGSYAAEYLYAAFEQGYVYETKHGHKHGSEHGPELEHDKKTGHEVSMPPFMPPVRILIGGSCGCHGRKLTIPEPVGRRPVWETEISEEGFDSVNSFMAEDLLAQTDLDGFLGTVYSYAYQLKGPESVHICLCEPWKYVDRSNNLSVLNEGYGERMVYALRYRADRKDGLASIENIFETSKLIPWLTEEHDKPRVLFFTPIFFENNCFGYSIADYGDKPESYDELYRRWVLLVSRGFEGLRRFVTARNLQSRLEKIKTGKFYAMEAAFDRLDDDEKEEYELVSKILDDNLLSYRFQPIVSTVDGSIYSYEALMRSSTDKHVPPLSIVKYADMQNRLADVERATFRNVLKIVEDHKEELGDAKIFINSIPGVRMTEEDLAIVEGYLRDLAETVVVELTEEAELQDDDLEHLKEMFKRMDVKIAVDDYGTGYSNISNLLRYMPDYVKIDRVLLRDVQNTPQKQHFVKEVIGFCHDNGILALAEGIETTEELRACILLGADLIQGFYTGKPANEFAGTIDQKVRDEIVKYHEEFTQGGDVRRYVAGMTNRVGLSALLRDGVSEIVVGQGAMIYKDITVFGTPGVKTNVHIRVENDYRGRITLENANLSNDVKNPCIEIGENAEVTLVITGENTLKNTGILVPKSSSLRLEGDGNLKIDLRALDFYGIGNVPTEEHGDLIFDLHGGTLEIGGHGVTGTCIGSGMGGKIRIRDGSYVMDANGQKVVCVGALFEDSEIRIEGSNLSAEFNAHDGAGIGSLTGNSKVEIKSSGIKLYCDGNHVVGIGSAEGESSEIQIYGAGIYISVSGQGSCGIGAMKGKTMLNVDLSSFKIEAAGSEALVVGGIGDRIHMDFVRTDVKWSARNQIGIDSNVKDENVSLTNCSFRFMINREEVEHHFRIVEETSKS